MCMQNDSGTPLRLAVLGMIAGNGHPYSWSAIINGYDPDGMAACPYPSIIQYLEAQPFAQVRIPNAQVTHLWTDNPLEAPTVARAALIPHVVQSPEEVIGKVDAVLIATDDGCDHVRRAQPFIRAGLPIFVDKPLATVLEDLIGFVRFHEAGARILSSSGMRYAPELDRLIRELPSLGSLRWISSVTCKTWERYGIHALEPVLRVLGPGFLSVRLETGSGIEIAHLMHRSGTQVSLPVIHDGAATFGTMHVLGAAGQAAVRFTDIYGAFRSQLISFLDFVRSGHPPHSFAETVELMAVLIAGIRSREEGARRVEIAEILAALN